MPTPQAPRWTALRSAARRSSRLSIAASKAVLANRLTSHASIWHRRAKAARDSLSIRKETVGFPRVAIGSASGFNVCNCIQLLTQMPEQHKIIVHTPLTETGEQGYD